MPRRLFFFPPIETGQGVMPSFYDEVPAESIADALAMGGVDMTESIEASTEYEWQLAYQTELSS